MHSRRDILKGGILSVTALGLGSKATESSSHQLHISNKLLHVQFDPSTGQLAIAAGGRVFAVGEFMAPGHSVGSVNRLADESHFGPGWAINITPGNNRIVVRNQTPFVLIRRDPRSTDSRTPGNHIPVYSPTLNLPGPSHAVRVLGAGGLAEPQHNPGQHVFTAIANPTTRSGVVAGLLQIDAASGVAFTSVRDEKVVLHLQNQYGSAIPPELKEFDGDWWAIGYFDDVREGLELWANEFTRVNHVKLKRGPVGYCTWATEKHGGSSDPADLIRLAEFESKKFRPFGFNFVQIDDGWQGGNGRNGPARQFWHVNPHGPYASGMKPVADKLKAMGLVAGLWMLPFGTDWKDPQCAFLLPLVVRKKNGEPYETAWGGTSLDMTNPKARDFVSSLISRAVRQWGFDYLKLDGMYTGLAVKQTYANMSYVADDYGDAVFADKDMSNMQAARLGLHTVRKAAGEATFILGCCTPQNQRSLGMTLGLVDAMRIGPDNDPQWNGMMNGVYAGSRTYFLNGRVWWNDPDTIYARSAVPRHEFLCYGSWVTLAGFLQISSDWAPDYSQQRIADLQCLMPSHQLNTVRPVDILENDPPRLWILRYTVSGQEHHVLGLFNWGGTSWSPQVNAAAVGLDTAADYTAYDFWADKPLSGLADLAAPIAAHACRIIALRKAALIPQVVSTSRHVTQGAIDLLSEHFDATSNILSGTSLLVADAPYTLRIDLGLNWQQISVHLVNAVTAEHENPVRCTFKTNRQWAFVQMISPQSGPVKWQMTFHPVI